MVTREKFTLGWINYLLKNNFASTSTIKTLILISLAINLTLLIIPPTIPQPTLILPLQQEPNYINLTL